MSQNINSTNSILREYIQLLREQQTLQTNILNTYHNSLMNSNNILNALLLRNFDRYSRRNNNENHNSQFGNTVYRNNRPLNINRERNSRNWGVPFFSARSERQSPVTTNMYTPGELRRRVNYSQRPIGRRSLQNPRNTTINNILLESFNTQPISSNPTLPRGRITEITSAAVWRDISNNTNQGICPFTQEEFLPDTCILTINSCGHIFTASHLERFFTRFGYRCPVCRADQRNISSTTTRTWDFRTPIRPSEPPPPIREPFSNIRNEETSNLYSNRTNNSTTILQYPDITRPITTPPITSTTSTNTSTNTSIPDDLTPLMESLFQTPEMNNIMNSVSNVLSSSFASALENQTYDASGNGIMSVSYTHLTLPTILLV